MPHLSDEAELGLHTLGTRGSPGGPPLCPEYGAPTRLIFFELLPPVKVETLSGYISGSNPSWGSILWAPCAQSMEPQLGLFFSSSYCPPVKVETLSGYISGSNPSWGSILWAQGGPPCAQSMEPQLGLFFSSYVRSKLKFQAGISLELSRVGAPYTRARGALRYSPHARSTEPQLGLFFELRPVKAGTGSGRISGP